jgi:hypothetical protein
MSPPPPTHTHTHTQATEGTRRGAKCGRSARHSKRRERAVRKRRGGSMPPKSFSLSTGGTLCGSPFPWAAWMRSAPRSIFGQPSGSATLAAATYFSVRTPITSQSHTIALLNFLITDLRLIKYSGCHKRIFTYIVQEDGKRDARDKRGAQP